MLVRRILLGICLPLVIIVGFYQISDRYFRSEEVEAARGRLSLYHRTVVAELNRFSHLTFILARDPFVIRTAQGQSTKDLNTRLASFAEQAGLDAIYLMRPDGETISSSNAGTDVSFIGHNYSFRPYFQQAMQGGQGRFYGIGTTTGLPGYFLTDAVVGAQGDVIGVIAIKVGLTRLEQAWRDGGESVILANQDGVILLASDESWRYRTLHPLTETQKTQIEKARQFSGQELDRLDWSILGTQRASVGGDNLIHLQTDQLPHNWVLHYFASEAAVTTRSWLTTVISFVGIALLVIFLQLRKASRMSEALRRSEAEETNLRQTNQRLAVEIDERRTAERRLQRTQDELERASRLAALGQLAASVTHELGQPIAAMRNHVVSAEISGKTNAGFLERIGGLVVRMEGITRQLKFFARSSDEPMQAVDICASTREALALVAPNMNASDVTLKADMDKGPVFVHGNSLRIEQVITNLLRNAIDAMEEADFRLLDVVVQRSGKSAILEIGDSGHGLGSATLSDLQEPFVTSRASGQGMGLGLAISAEIIKEHHGQIHAENKPVGGALFRVEIPLLTIEEDP